MGGTPPNKLAVRRGWSRPLSRSITTYLLLHTMYVHRATTEVYVIGAIEITMIGHLLCTKILRRIFLLNTQTPCTYITHLSLHFFLLNWAIDLQLQMSNFCWQHLSSVNVIITDPGPVERFLNWLGPVIAKLGKEAKLLQCTLWHTLESGIELAPWINVVPGPFGKKKKKRSPLNKVSPPLK
jgi:hypothetical protein